MKLLSVLALLSLISFKTNAKDLVFCTDSWIDQTADAKGSYVELVKNVYGAKYNVVIKLYPWARAKGSFLANQCDGLIGENKINQETTVRPEMFLEQSMLYAFFVKGKFEFKGDETLKEKLLAWKRGYGYEQLTPLKLNFVEISELVQGYRLLAGNRFDIFINYDYEFEDLCKKSGIDCSNIEMVPSGIVEKTYVVFHNSQEGNELVKMWDTKLKEMIKSKEVYKLFKKFNQTYRGK